MVEKFLSGFPGTGQTSERSWWTGLRGYFRIAPGGKKNAVTLAQLSDGTLLIFTGATSALGTPRKLDLRAELAVGRQRANAASN